MPVYANIFEKMFSPAGNLYRVDQVPEHFKELFILSGYRNPRSSLLQCVLSVFRATNETINFWSHFLPAIFFSYKTYQYYVELDFTHDAYTFPLLAYLLTLCLFPFTSAVAHVFNTMSDKARHVCFFLDYWALSQFSVGAAIAYNTYVFPESLLEGKFHSMFLQIAIINGVFSLVISCQSRFMKSGVKKKMLRVLAYGFPYLYDSLPVIYRLLWCLPHECTQRAIAPHTYQFVCAFVASFFYLSHWPERSFPGRFDIVGHSHQLFHLFTVLGSYLQLTGLLNDLSDRRTYLIQHHNMPSVMANTVLMVSVAVVDLVILLYFINKLNHVTHSDDSWLVLYGDKRKTYSLGAAGDFNENMVMKKHDLSKGKIIENGGLLKRASVSDGTVNGCLQTYD